MHLFPRCSGGALGFFSNHITAAAQLQVLKQQQSNGLSLSPSCPSGSIYLLLVPISSYQLTLLSLAFTHIPLFYPFPPCHPLTAPPPCPHKFTPVSCQGWISSFISLLFLFFTPGCHTPFLLSLPWLHSRSPSVFLPFGRLVCLYIKPSLSWHRNKTFFREWSADF